MCLTSDVDINVLAQCFELDPYDQLLKPKSRWAQSPRCQVKNRKERQAERQTDRNHERNEEEREEEEGFIEQLQRKIPGDSCFKSKFSNTFMWPNRSLHSFTSVVSI